MHLYYYIPKTQKVNTLSPNFLKKFGLFAFGKVVRLWQEKKIKTCQGKRQEQASPAYKSVSGYACPLTGFEFSYTPQTHCHPIYWGQWLPNGEWQMGSRGLAPLWVWAKPTLKTQHFSPKNAPKPPPQGRRVHPAPVGWRSCLKYSITFKQLRRIVASSMNTDKNAPKNRNCDNLTASHLVIV